MIKSKQGTWFYLIYSFQSCASYLHSCKQLLQPAWTLTRSITLGKTQYQCTFILLMGKDTNGNWYLLRQGTTGLLQKLSKSFSRYSWKLNHIMHLHTPQLQTKYLNFFHLCSFCHCAHLAQRKQLFIWQLLSPIHSREDDRPTTKLQWSLFMPTRCHVVYCQDENG